MLRAERFLRNGRGTLLVYIGTRHVEWQCTGHAAMSLPLPSQHGDLPDILLQITVPPGVTGMRVVLADHRVAAASVPWRSQMGNAGTAAGFAREQLQADGHVLDERDTIRLDNAPYGMPRLAIAYPQPLLQALQECALRLGLRLRSVLPLSVLVWPAMRRRAARHVSAAQALVIIDGDMVLVAHGDNPDSASLLTLNVRMAEEGASAHVLMQDCWRRLCLRQPQWNAVQQVAVLQIHHADASPATLTVPFVGIDLGLARTADHLSVTQLMARYGLRPHALDAIADGAGVGRRLWLGLPGMAAVLFLWLALSAAADVNVLRTQLRELRNAPAVQTSQRSVWKARDVPRIVAVNTAIRQLNMPLATLLQALTPPPDIRVTITSAETAGSIDGTRGQLLKVAASADSSVDMTRYVAYLDERKPLLRAYLTQHERDPGGEAWRFSLEVAWRD